MPRRRFHSRDGNRAAACGALCEQAGRCRRCPRLAGKQAVLSALNGPLSPRVLFIGEAPGRRGADRTRRPFTGDESGERFGELLAQAGLRRGEVFITNAVLCCPADARKNRPPLGTEIRNCNRFLRRTLEVIRPPVVATVGVVALGALARLLGRRYKLSEVAGTIIPVDGFLLVPLYHPSPRVLHTVRSLPQQRADFAALGRAVQQCEAARADP